MANFYKYGTYREVLESKAEYAVQAGTVPVYIGTSPVNLVTGWKEQKLVNYPVEITSMSKAQAKLGYSSDWGSFTLQEPIAAHFDNSIGNIGPVLMINVLDPDVHKKETPTELQLQFTNGRAEIRTDTAILDSFQLLKPAGDSGEEEPYLLREDYLLDYNYTKGAIVISSADSENPLTGVLKAKFDEVDPSMITYEDVIGGLTSSGEYSGIKVIDRIYPELFTVVNLIAAPGWSHIPAVYRAMIQECQEINGHWDAYVCADIPLVDQNAKLIDTIDKAVEWKQKNNYESEHSKVCWPMGEDEADRKFHVSTMATVEFMRADFSHNSVPMETCGNKEVALIRQYFGENSLNQGFDEVTGRELTKNGICTLKPYSGGMYLWGDHTAAYTYGKELDQRKIFDVSMRIIKYVTNSFQREWALKIDKPFNRTMRDQILNREQEKLDRLYNMGAILDKGKVTFEESENSTADMINGDFTWNMDLTPTPPLKSATLKIRYVDDGFANLLD